MASTRRIMIFEDSGSTADQAEMSQQSPRGHLGDIIPENNIQSAHVLRGDIVLDPPVPEANGRSPLKPIRQPSTSRPKTLFGNKASISLPPPQASAFTTDSPIKQPCVTMCHPIARPKSLKPIFSTFSSTVPPEKENLHPNCYSDNFAEFPDPSYGYKTELKRTISSATAQPDQPSKMGFEEGSEVLDPAIMPLVPDDGKKPPYSYAALIGMSILRAPSRRLTLAQIYRWISDTFSYYRIQETGWQNSIRHNLSLNKAFIKQERPKDDPGKGNYWAIEPGMESQFIKDKSSRHSTSSAGPSIKGTSLFSQEANAWSSQPPPPPPAPLKAAPKTTKHGSEMLEPSSDATIPASDVPSQDDEVEEATNMPPPSLRLPVSSPLQDIRSSPPLAHSTSLQDDTPSPEADSALPSSNLRSRKRKMAAMDDSGYFSSLDSSASRPPLNPKLRGLDTDRPQIKRGRAEEEIARIRSSSHDISPSKGRSFLKQPTPSLVSSSPLRHFDNTLMLPPLTPAVKFKLPPKPPASISPNTNLRNHRNKIRELVGSPIKNTSFFSDDVSFSPAFNIVGDEHSTFEDEYPAFNIFTDNQEEDYSHPASTSPVKRSIRRPRTERPSQTSNILEDVTATNLNIKLSPFDQSVFNFGSPLQRHLRKSPNTLWNDTEDFAKEDMFGFDLLENEEPEDFGGLDILQGFQKIGGNHHPPQSARRSRRPPLTARSYTSRF